MTSPILQRASRSKVLCFALIEAVFSGLLNCALCDRPDRGHGSTSEGAVIEGPSPSSADEASGR